MVEIKKIQNVSDWEKNLFQIMIALIVSVFVFDACLLAWGLSYKNIVV